MQHLGVNFGGIWRFELFSLSGFLLIFFCSGNRGWFLTVQWQHVVTGLTPTGRVPRVAACNAMQMPLFRPHPFKSAIMWRIQTPHLVQLMITLSNYIFDCNNRDANRACVTFRDKKLIRRWDSERELSLPHRTRTTKCDRHLHKFRHKLPRFCVVTRIVERHASTEYSKP